MTVLEALAILEAAVLECKKRNVDTPEVRAALDFLEPYIRPEWLIPQYRDHVAGPDRTDRGCRASKVNSRFFAQLSPDPQLSPRTSRGTGGCTSEEIPRDT